MLKPPMQRVGSDSAETLVQAGARALARPEEGAGPAHRERLAALSRVAEEASPSDFVTSLADAAPALLGYLLSFELEGAPPGFLRAYSGDAFCRFLHTLEVTPRPVSGSVLEIGANPYLFHLLLRAIFPKASLVGSNFFDHDIFSTRVGRARHCLRSPQLREALEFDFLTFNLETVHPYPFPSSSFDLVYFCETLEHLVVSPLRVFREIRRILRPGGHLVLTLPNAVRLTNVGAMLAGRNSFDLYQEGNGVHGRHNREFTLAEVRTLLERDGYEIARAETRDRFDYDTVPIEAVDYSGPPAPLPWRRTDLLRWLRSAGGTTDDRGDNLYVVARRPTGARMRGGRRTEAAEGGSDDGCLVSFLDALEETSGGLRVTGWAFFTGDASGLPCEVEIVLRGRDRTTVQRAEAMSRPDVAAAHGLPLDEVGFTATVPCSAFPVPDYEVLVRLRSAGGSTAVASLARRDSTGGPSLQGPTLRDGNA